MKQLTLSFPEKCREIDTIAAYAAITRVYLASDRGKAAQAHLKAHRMPARLRLVGAIQAATHLVKYEKIIAVYEALIGRSVSRLEDSPEPKWAA